MTSDAGKHERVGILGGSFDPIHNGHLELAGAAIAERDLDRVILVPARHQPHKRSAPAASARHRLAMIRLAIRGRGELSVSDCELCRPGKSFTVDTLRELRRRLGPDPELFFVVGSDTIGELLAWKDPEELTRLCAFIVAARPGWALDELDALSRRLSADWVAATKALAIDGTACPVSSTQVRDRVASGRPLSGLVPGPVAAYVAKNRLYTAR